MQRSLDGGGTEFVGRAYRLSSLDPATCHPHGETIGIVVAPRRLLILGNRLATELTTPNNQGAVEKPLAL